MKTTIYYFSGTGNSLVVAREIAAAIQADMVPIAFLADAGGIRPQADTIGIVFPVYYGEPPMMVDDFLGRLRDIAGKYIFAVCTYGGAADASLRILKRRIGARGGILSAAFGVRMPQNAFLKPREDRQKIENAWKKRLKFIVHAVQSKKKGLFYTNLPLELIMMLVHAPFIRPACRREFIKLSGLPGNTPYKELKHSSDNGFRTDGSCGGCGACEKVCPCNNIIITSGRPVWQNRCEHCLACYNCCPNKAITGGITHGYRYRHPLVSSADISAQKGLQ